jgi:hypothetical protein
MSGCHSTSSKKAENYYPPLNPSMALAVTDCSNVTAFGQQCGDDRIDIRAKFSNSEGETVQIQVNDTVYDIVVRNTRATLSVSGITDATITLVDPAGCWEPLICGDGGGDPPPPPPPPATGACCTDGSCSVVALSDCFGTYHGDNSECTPDLCPQPPPILDGACCELDGSCNVAEEVNCFGSYQGDNTTCSNLCPQPPPSTGCPVSGQTYIATGNVNLTNCNVPSDAVIVLTDAFFTYSVPVAIDSLTVNGTVTLNPINNSSRMYDLNMNQLILNGTLNEAVRSIIEFFSNDGDIDIVGNGTLNIYRIEHEGSPGLKLLGSVNFGSLVIYDITGGFSSLRTYTANGNISMDALLLLEKQTMFDIQGYRIEVGRLRARHSNTWIRGVPGATLIVGNGSPATVISGNYHVPTEYVDNLTIVWE